METKQTHQDGSHYKTVKSKL